MDDARREALTAEELVARGEYRAATEQAMEQYGTEIYAFCRYKLRDDALAEDALQDVFLQAYRDISKLQDPSSLRWWLRKIAKHRLYDAIDRRTQQRNRMDDDDEAIERVADAGDGPRERLSSTRLNDALIQCLDGLSELARVSVMMRFYERLSYKEMATATDTKVDAHNARVSRALPVLRACLESKGWHHG